MKRAVFNIRFLLVVSLAVAAGVWPMAAQAASLGTAARFAVLARTAVTCTGPNSNVTGPVGVASSATAVTKTGCTMAVQVAASPYASFLNTYKTGLGPCSQTFTAPTLTGPNTLAPGTYCFPAALTMTTGTLNLTGGGPWNFEIGTTAVGALTTTNFNVISSNPCNVFWWVHNDVTLTTSTPPLPGAFQGTLLAGGDITLTDTVLTGRAWAGGGPQTAVPNGAVTLTRSPIVGCTAAGKVPGQCTEDNDKDKDKDNGDNAAKSNAGAARPVSVGSLTTKTNASSHGDGNDGNDENDENSEHDSHDGCDSEDSNHDNDDNDNNDNDHKKKSGD
jgi:hypothetical protein